MSSLPESVDPALTLEAAPATAARLGARSGLVPWNTSEAAFMIGDMETAYDALPVADGYHLRRADHSTLQPVAFARRIDDVLRLLAIQLMPCRWRWHVTHADVPSGFAVEGDEAEVQVREVGDQEPRVRIWGLATHRKLAITFAICASATLDEMEASLASPDGSPLRRG